MTYEATATFDSGKELVFVLEKEQVEDFVFAIFNKSVYKDEKSGVLAWLPPERLLALVVKPNLESPKCLKNQPSEVESALLT